METVQPRDDKSPVVNITSQSATPVGGQGERSKEHLIDPPSKPGSQVDSPATADYTAIQIDQEDTVSHEAQKDTNDDSETLAVNPFSNLAHYSILRHQETLASWEKQLQERGSLDETEVQSLRETLRIYYAEIRDARDIHNISAERLNGRRVDVFPPPPAEDVEPKKKVDDFDNINDETVKYIVKAIVFASFPVLFVIAAIRVVRMTPGQQQRSLGDLLFSIEHVYLKLDGYFERFARSLIAIIGSMALLAPVLILSYVEPLKYRLLTVCLSVIIFAICSMIVLKSKTSELVVIVAAYTAVLVVYIGPG